jgi:hypothetical protein
VLLHPPLRGVEPGSTAVYEPVTGVAISCSQGHALDITPPIMGFTLYNLLKAALLVLNAMALLHPARFLRRCTFAGGSLRYFPTFCHLISPDTQA